jgi:hypothetical protein
VLTALAAMVLMLLAAMVLTSLDVMAYEVQARRRYCILTHSGTQSYRLHCELALNHLRFTVTIVLSRVLDPSHHVVRAAAYARITCDSESRWFAMSA